MNIAAARICRFVFATALLIQPVISFSQTSQATLQGQIINRSNGQPVAGAVVIERDLERNSQSYRYTNDQGIYYFPALLPGTYSVRVDALGFRPEERSAVTLAVASRVELNFGLNATETSPQQAQAVPVKPNAKNILSVMYGSDAAVPQAVLTDLPLQSTETLVASISSLITEREILELPLSGRDVYTLLVLQPGVSSDNATNRGLGFSVNGQRVGSSNFLLDGVDNNDLLVTGPATFVSADAVKEYRMTTNNYTAEFGRASGFVANAVTRTGGNALHGTLLEYFNNTRLNANSFNYNALGIARTPYHRDQYGGSIGRSIAEGPDVFLRQLRERQVVGPDVSTNNLCADSPPYKSAAGWASQTIAQRISTSRWNSHPTRQLLPGEGLRRTCIGHEHIFAWPSRLQLCGWTSSPQRAVFAIT